MLLFVIGWLCCMQAQAQCTASFTATAAPLNNSPLRVSISSTSSVGSITGTQYALSQVDFGDGIRQYHNSNNITHNYATPGTYTIWLKIMKLDSMTGTILCQDSTNHSVVVNYPPCYATISTTNGPGAGQVTFTATNPAGTPGVSYRWDFGDGTPVTSGNPVSHTYSQNGTYTVRLYDTVAGTCAFTTTRSVTITGVPPNCSNLHAQFATGQNVNVVQFFNSSYVTTSYPSASLSYVWEFGDGTGTSDKNPLHAYTTPGTYIVKLLALWIDTSNYSLLCRDSVYSTITVNSIATPINCSGLTAAFTSSVSANVATFTNTSTAVALPYSSFSNWSWGDNTPALTSSNTTVTHTYANPGTYNVRLITTWMDTIYQTHCRDTFFQTVTIVPGPAGISGFIISDSMRVDTNNYKVWLIQYDSISNNLFAVDSLSITGSTATWTPYSFTGKPAGAYLVKAAKTNAIPASLDLVPTYHVSSLYWNTAQIIVLNGISRNNRNILMQSGTVTAGPGFIAGNVSLGANKGASGGVPGMTILLRGTNNALVKAVQTDANGDFSFSSLPVGTYNVYPEEMGYATTPYANIVITGAQNNVTDIDFRKDNALKNIKPGTTSVGQVTANTALFTLYPNPAAHTINLEWKQLSGKQADILISDITGQVVIRQSIAVTAATQQVDVRKLQTGIYFVKVISGGMESTHKLVIRH